MKKFLIKVFEHYFKYFYVFRLVPNEKENNIAIDKKFELKIIEDNKSHYFDKILLPQEYLEIIKSRLKSEYFVCFAVIDTEKDQLAYYSWINLSPRYWVREVNQFYFFGRSKSCLFEDDNTLVCYRVYKLHSYVIRERINYFLRNIYCDSNKEYTRNKDCKKQ